MQQSWQEFFNRDGKRVLTDQTLFKFCLQFTQKFRRETCPFIQQRHGVEESKWEHKRRRLEIETYRFIHIYTVKSYGGMQFITWRSQYTTQRHNCDAVSCLSRAHILCTVHGGMMMIKPVLLVSFITQSQSFFCFIIFCFSSEEKTPTNNAVCVGTIWYVFGRNLFTSLASLHTIVTLWSAGRFFPIWIWNESRVYRKCTRWKRYK